MRFFGDGVRSEVFWAYDFIENNVDVRITGKLGESEIGVNCELKFRQINSFLSTCNFALVFTFCKYFRTGVLAGSTISKDKGQGEFRN